MLLQTVISVLGAIGGMGAGVSAYLSYRQMQEADRQRQANLLVEIAVRHLERAWNSLTVNGTQTSRPPNDKLRWLTASRHIIDYLSTRDLIKDATVKQRCLEEEAHWRHQFYETLSPLAFDSGYFPNWRNPRAPVVGEHINETSAIIVHRFSDWPEGRDDAIEVAKRRYADMTDPAKVSIRWAELRKALGLHRCETESLHSIL